MAKKKVTKVCSCCGSDLELSNFYISYSPIYQVDKKIPACKNCLEQIYADNLSYYMDEEKALYRSLMMFDIVYDAKLVIKLQVDNFDKADTNLMMLYMGKVNTYNKNKTFRNSDFLNIWDVEKIDEPNYTIELLEDYKANVVTKDMVSRWGKGRMPEDYMFLEERYNIMKNTYAVTPNSLWLYEQIARNYLSIKKEEEKDNPDWKKINAIMDSNSKLSNDCKMKTVQTSNDEANEYFSKFIVEVEKNEPIPQAEKEFADVDNIKKYIQKWFVKPFARAKKVEEGGRYEDDLDKN